VAEKGQGAESTPTGVHQAANGAQTGAVPAGVPSSAAPDEGGGGESTQVPVPGDGSEAAHEPPASSSEIPSSATRTATPTEVPYQGGPVLRRSADGTITFEGPLGMPGKVYRYSTVDGSWQSEAGDTQRFDWVNVEELDYSAEEWESLADHLATTARDNLQSEVARAERLGLTEDARDLRAELSTLGERERRARDMAAKLRGEMLE
jgi:hypothetical protein